MLSLCSRNRTGSLSLIAEISIPLQELCGYRPGGAELWRLHMARSLVRSGEAQTLTGGRDRSFAAPEHFLTFRSSPGTAERPFTVTGLADGTHVPEGDDYASFAERILNSAYFEYSDEECPDGEYLVLELPESHGRFDFFYLGDGRYVRMTQYGYELLFHCRTDVNVTELVEQWYDALQ